MKKIFFLIINILVFTGCEEVIDVDLASDTGRLVIDARVERIYNTPEDEIINEVFVNLSLTTSFYDTTPNYVNNAEVSLTDQSSNTVYTLESVNESGLYSILPSSDFEVQNDTEYMLTVVYNNETYQASEVLNISVPIDDVFQFKASEEIIEPEDVAVNITYTDLPGLGNYYIFGFNNMNFLATDDEFIKDGKEFSFEYFYEDPPTEILTIFVYGSDKRTNNYVDSIEELSEGGSNGPFSTVPYEVKGNIANVTNPNNYPYGYYRINEVYFTQIDLINNEDAPEAK